jgi:hypothetical protein
MVSINVFTRCAYNIFGKPKQMLAKTGGFIPSLDYLKHIHTLLYVFTNKLLENKALKVFSLVSLNVFIN